MNVGLTSVASLGTVALYFGARHVAARAASLPGRARRLVVALTLPIVVTSLLVIALVTSVNEDFVRYDEGARPLSFWLGPATAALAVPVYRERDRIRRHLRAVLSAVVAGSLASMGLVVGLCLALKMPGVLLRSLVAKSVTTPIAMPITERLGGVPSITAAVVIITGVVGMLVGPPLLSLFGVRSPLARGLALGTAAHGIGTAAALEESRTTGALGGVAMVLAGVLTGLVAPWIPL